jgi:hypothetical protein
MMWWVVVVEVVEIGGDVLRMMVIWRGSQLVANAFPWLYVTDGGDDAARGGQGGTTGREDERRGVARVRFRFGWPPLRVSRLCQSRAKSQEQMKR